MKKFISFMSVAAAAFALAGCQEKDVETFEPNVNEGSTFELYADIAQTKTTLDGYNLEWEDGDIIYMVTTDGTWGKPYADDNDGATIAEFTYNDGMFAPNISIADGAYTFNAIYTRADQKSFHRAAATSHQLKAIQTQDCENPTAHVKDNDALVGTFTATTPLAEPASVEMNHLYTMMEVDVKNNTGAEIEVVKFEMTATGADLAGVFSVTSFESSTIQTKSGASDKITVNLTGGTVANGSKLPVYFVMAPLSDYSGDVTFRVTDADSKTYTKTVSLENKSFLAGKYNTTSYTISAADEVEPKKLPWNEDFSGDLSQYVLVNGDGAETKIYAQNLAKGEAPELLVSKNGGSMTARIATEGYVGGLTLTFKSNYPGYLNVTTTTEGVSVTKDSDSEYIITINKPVEIFTLTIINENGSNARLDNISLVEGVREKQTLVFAETEYNFELSSDEMSAFTGQTVTGANTTVTYSSSNEYVASVNAETGVVTFTNNAGSTIITATACETSEYKEATASYVINVKDGSIQTGTAVLEFDNTAKRTSHSTSAQVWQDNGITFTNNKGSGSNIIDSCSPVRLYKNSEIIVSMASEMMEINFACNTTGYATALKDSIDSNAATVTVSDKNVTVVLSSPANSFTIALSGGQVRLDALTVTYITTQN